MKSHAKPKFACSQCDKQFSQLRNFKYHMSIHLGTKEFAGKHLFDHWVLNHLPLK